MDRAKQWLEMSALSYVQHTPVFRPDGVRIGWVRELIIDRRSGKIECALLDFGEYLDMDEALRPIPWNALKHRDDLQGYSLSVEDDTLASNPVQGDEVEARWDREFLKRVYSYFGED